MTVRSSKEGNKSKLDETREETGQPKNKGGGGLPNVDVEKIVEQKVAEALRKQGGDSAAFSQRQVDVSDMLETPVYYFTYSYWYKDYGYTYKGQLVRPPYGSVEFKPHFRFSKPGKKGEETISISRAEVMTKSEKEYVESHPDYGIKFFKHTADVESADSTLMEQMTRYSNQVKAMDDRQVISQAKHHDVKMTDDLEILRSRLIERLAKDELKKMKETTEKIFKEGTRENPAKSV